jgi:hypothetical protein
MHRFSNALDNVDAWMRIRRAQIAARNWVSRVDSRYDMPTEYCVIRVKTNLIPSILVQVFAIAGKGYGLRTLDAIERGRFVCDYAGEVRSLVSRISFSVACFCDFVSRVIFFQVIDAAEVERRASCGKREHNYVLTLKEHFAGRRNVFFTSENLYFETFFSLFLSVKVKYRCACQ